MVKSSYYNLKNFELLLIISMWLKYFNLSLLLKLSRLPSVHCVHKICYSVLRWHTKKNVKKVLRDGIC